MENMVVLVLGTLKSLDRVRGAAAALGMSAGRPGRVEPGTRTLIATDLAAFDRLAAAAGGTRRLGRSLEQPLVVLLGTANVKPAVVRRVSEAGGICVPPDCERYLPEILRRLSMGGPPPVAARIRCEPPLHPRVRHRAAVRRIRRPAGDHPSKLCAAA